MKIVIVVAHLAICAGILLYLHYGGHKRVKLLEYYNDGTTPKFYITGDKHRDFREVKRFCRVKNTQRQDVLIVLGDAGLNYYGDYRDDKLKKEVSSLNITVFCVHGNKENRPENVGTYGIRSFCGGTVYYEPRYPNIYFAIDGEIYTFEKKKYMVIGGGHSVDKMLCLEEKRPFWQDEMPDEATKEKVEHRIDVANNSIYGMMTHTCPIDYLPTEAFVSARQKMRKRRKRLLLGLDRDFCPDIDRSTEEWLGKLERKLDYKVWYCGHYHVDKRIDKIHMMHQEIRPLHNPLLGDEL